MTITGSNLGGAVAVVFNSTRAPILSDSATSGSGQRLFGAEVTGTERRQVSDWRPPSGTASACSTHSPEARPESYGYPKRHDATSATNPVTRSIPLAYVRSANRAPQKPHKSGLR